MSKRESHEIYVSTDVAANGPIPGPYSMPGFGVCLTVGLALVACTGERTPGMPVEGTPPIVATTSARAPATSATAADGSGGDRAPGRFSPQALLDHVRALASPALAGRKVASAGERAALDYVARVLEGAGVPAPPGGRRHDFAPAGGWEVVAGQSANVYGLVAGSRPAEHVIVGAHVDHLGQVSLPDGDGGVRAVVHLGAEDNASGVAVVLEVARALAAYRTELGRSVLLAFFGAEEIGLLGSRQYVRMPPLPLDRAIAMVNVDMMGRPLADQAAFALLKIPLGIDGARSVGVIGTEGRPALREIVDRACKTAGLRALGPEDFPDLIRDMLNRMARDRGDSASFARAGIPAVFFSAGESDDFHHPDDTVERLDPVLMARRAEVVYHTIVALSHAARADVQPR